MSSPALIAVLEVGAAVSLSHKPPALALRVLRNKVPYDLSRSCQSVVKAEKIYRLVNALDKCFLRVELKSEACEIETDICLRHLQPGQIRIQDEEVIHISDVISAAELLLYKMVHTIENGYPCDLDHLGARIETVRTVVLLSYDRLHRFECLRRKSSLKCLLCQGVTHSRIISVDVTLKHIPVKAVLPEEAAQHVGEQVSCEVCSFALLTRTVRAYEALYHSRVNSIIIQRTLIYAVSERYGDYVSALGCIYSKAPRLFCLIGTALKFVRELDTLFKRV